MVLPELHVPGSLLGAGAGAAITAGFSWLRSRSRTAAYTMGAVDHAVQTAMASVTSEVDRLNTQVTNMHAQHERCEAELEDGRIERVQLRRQIDGLMAGRVARPGEAPPS